MSNTRTMTRRTYMPKSEALASPDTSIAPCSGASAHCGWPLLFWSTSHTIM